MLRVFFKVNLMRQSILKTFAGVTAALCACLTVPAQKKLTIIGSSTSDCYGIASYDSCYVGRLQQYYGSAIAITRLAVSGSSVYKGMPTGYIPPATRSLEMPDTAHNITAALQTHPDVVLVNYPSNGYDVYSVAESMYCLRVIKDAANGAGVACYITTTQPRSEPYPYSTPEIRKKMAEIKDSVLNEFGPFAINFWNDIVNPADSTIITSLGQGDGTHLNSAGHKILAEKVIAKNIFSPSILPLTFTGVTASLKDDKTLLVWTTAGDENVIQYEVQQSADGMLFSTVYQLKPVTTAGAGHQYAYTCPAPDGSMSYYRIAARYADGKTELSAIIKVLSARQSFTIEKLYLKAPDLIAAISSGKKATVYLQVVNTTGQVLLKTTATVNAGITKLPVRLTAMGKGVYFLRVSDNASAWQTRSFMK